MKITKQRLKEIIREELEYVGAEIDQFEQPEAEDDSSHVAELLGTPEGTMIAKIMARKIIDQFASFPELADAIEGIDRDEVTARAVAAMRGNRLYDPMEEYRSTGTGDRKKPAPRPSSDTRSSNTGYRSGATGKKNQGRGGY